MIPASWQRSTIGEMCEMVKGSAPISKTVPGPYPLVTTGEEHRTADHYQFDAAAVCVPMISSTGHGHASLKRVHYVEGKFALANLLTALLVRDPEVLDPRFLHLYLNYFKDQLIVPLMVGAANMSLTTRRLAAIPLAFPHVQEQRRILSQLDKTNSIRRLCTRADTRITTLLPAIFRERFGEPVVGSGRFRWAALRELVRDGDKVNYGVVQPGGDFPNGVPLVRVGDYRRMRISSSLKRIDPAIESQHQRSRLLGDEVLVACVGSIGSVAVADEHLRGANIARAVARIRCGPSVEPWYLAFFLATPLVQNYFSRMTRTVAQPTLNIGIIEQTQVPVPPLQEQRAFVKQVEAVRALEIEQSESRRKLEELHQSMLHRSFRGEL